MLFSRTRTALSWRVLTFQSSAPAVVLTARDWPSGLIAMAVAGSPLPPSGCTEPVRWRLATFHGQTVPSLVPPATVAPPG